jgi:2-aminoadipate transaminase
VDIADRYGVPIIEDDPYGELRFEGEHLPPLVVLDADRLNGRQYNFQNGPNSYFKGNVIYMSTFSKTLAPGLRLGWIVAPASVIQHCVMVKQGMDLHTSSFIQMVAYEVAKDGFLTEHVRQIRDVYRERRDIMLAAMSEHFPPGVRWTRPEGGLFLWVTLAEELDSTAVLEEAINHKVAYVPGAAFYPDGKTRNNFRLNFSNAQPEQIQEGIARLGQVLHNVIEPLPVY